MGCLILRITPAKACLDVGRQAQQIVRLRLAVTRPPGLSGVRVMRIGGELDVPTIPTVRKCLNSQLAEQPSVLFLDLTGVEFLSTAAVRMMLEAREAGDRVGTVVLVMGAPRRSVARALTRRGLADSTGCWGARGPHVRGICRRHRSVRSGRRGGPAVQWGRSLMAKSGRRGLVLGAGGILGAAWTVGALSAIEEATGWDPRQAGVIVGTSAGSVLAALLRAGTSVQRLHDLHGYDRAVDDVPEVHARVVGPVDRWARYLDEEPCWPGWPRPGFGSVPLTLRAVCQPLTVAPSAACAAVLPRGRRSLAVLGDLIEESCPDGRWPRGPGSWR